MTKVTDAASGVASTRIGMRLSSGRRNESAYNVGPGDAQVSIVRFWNLLGGTSTTDAAITCVDKTVSKAHAHDDE